MVGGTDAFNRRRLVQRVVEMRQKDGWEVVPVDGSESDALDSVFAMSMMFAESRLVIISKPEKLDPALVLEQLNSPDPKLTFLLVTELEKPEGPVFDSIPKTHRSVFNLPPFYKMEEYAANFAVKEAKAKGNVLKEDLALALVRKVGSDLGVISFEIQKICLLMEPGAEIDALTLRETLAALSETDGTSIIEAIGYKNEKRLAVELAKYQESRGGDPTIELCGRVLTPTIVRWLQAAHLHEAGMAPAAAAGAAGQNPWYWENKILPLARAWKVSGCARLIRIIAKAQTLVFQGSTSPFAYLESALLEAVQSG
jgi:DNA polymerase III delta subunit